MLQSSNQEINKSTQSLPPFETHHQPAPSSRVPRTTEDWDHTFSFTLSQIEQINHFRKKMPYNPSISQNMNGISSLLENSAHWSSASNEIFSSTGLDLTPRPTTSSQPSQTVNPTKTDSSQQLPLQHYATNKRSPRSDTSANPISRPHHGVPSSLSSTAPNASRSRLPYGVPGLPSTTSSNDIRTRPFLNVSPKSATVPSESQPSAFGLKNDDVPQQDPTSWAFWDNNDQSPLITANRVAPPSYLPLPDSSQPSALADADARDFETARTTRAVNLLADVFSRTNLKENITPDAATAGGDVSPDFPVTAIPRQYPSEYFAGTPTSVSSAPAPVTASSMPYTASHIPPRVERRQQLQQAHILNNFDQSPISSQMPPNRPAYQTQPPLQSVSYSSLYEQGIPQQKASFDSYQTTYEPASQAQQGQAHDLANLYPPADYPPYVRPLASYQPFLQQQPTEATKDYDYPRYAFPPSPIPISAPLPSSHHVSADHIANSPVSRATAPFHGLYPQMHMPPIQQYWAPAPPSLPKELPPGLPSDCSHIVSTEEGLRCAVMEDLRTSSTPQILKKWSLRDLKGHITILSGDQHGSRFLQHHLESVANSEERELVFNEILPNALQLMCDVFGNYVVQKLFVHGTQAQKSTLCRAMSGRVMHLSLQMYGCRVVQKAFEHVLVDEQSAITAELQGDVQALVENQNGNHVIQKAIEFVPSQYIRFIFETFRNNIQAYSMHSYGCRIVQRLLEYSQPEDRKWILAEIHACAVALVIDQYGNYVVQKVIEKGPREDSQRLIQMVFSSLMSFSKHKFASNVVEKCLECCSDEGRTNVLNQLTKNTTYDTNPPEPWLLSLMRDQYGNYVIQTMLNVLHGEQHEMLTLEIIPLLVPLKQTVYGKQVANLEALIYGNDNQRPRRQQRSRATYHSSPKPPVFSNGNNHNYDTNSATQSNAATSGRATSPGQLNLQDPENEPAESHSTAPTSPPTTTGEETCTSPSLSSNSVSHLEHCRPSPPKVTADSEARDGRS